MFAVAVFILLWLGLYPQTLLRTADQSVGVLLERTTGAEQPTTEARP